MDDRTSRELLRDLCQAAGPPGAEDEVRKLVRQRLDGCGEIRYDRLGSLLCERPGSGSRPRIMLDCHLDEVAFMVQSIGAEGRLGFVTLGSWWGHVLLGQTVEILGSAGRVHGVIGAKPPHFLGAEERLRVVQPESMYIDIGAHSREQAEQLGLRIGDAVVPRAEFREMQVDDVLCGKAFDNRIGVCLMCETMQQLQTVEHPNTVIGVGAVQEEVGLRGAATACELADPDLAIVLECTPADDLPGQTERQAVLGRGPQIRHFDPTAISNRRLIRLVETVAEQEQIPIQMAVRRSGGTDAGSIHRTRAGVPTVVIGVPARYIHTHSGLLHWQDYLAARKLVMRLILALDEQTAADLTRFEE